MRSFAILAIFPVLLSATLTLSADMSVGKNFTVLAPDRALATAVLQQAEVYRSQAARDWLAERLPDRLGRSMITVDISSQEDEGFTWPIDSPERTLHQIWLTTSVERAVGTTLQHEVIHTVLDTHFFPETIPAWASEGIASQADDAGRKDDQRLMLARWVRTNRWPNLRSLFQYRRLEHNDLTAYVAASSIVEFLVEQGGKPRVVEFASAGAKQGWDAAARKLYAARDVSALQVAWQTWVIKKVHGAIGRKPDQQVTLAAGARAASETSSP
jgi:hypothetical protein